MPYADTQAACEQLQAQVATRDRQLAPKAVERLAHAWERCGPFAQFPREQWRHLRTTNVVESPVAAVRLCTTAATRLKKVDTATAMIWKVLQVDEIHLTLRELFGYVAQLVVQSRRSPFVSAD